MISRAVIPICPPDAIAEKLGTATAARMPKITQTNKSSTNVKPNCPQDLFFPCGHFRKHLLITIV